MPKDLLEKFDGEFDELAKDYANASYLVSEENHDEKEEIEALARLKSLARSHIEAAYQSNLERLIEKLGDGEIQIIRRQKSNKWSAVIMKGLLPDHDWQHGSTPTEAVENLIKALGK